MYSLNVEKSIVTDFVFFTKDLTNARFSLTKICELSKRTNSFCFLECVLETFLHILSSNSATYLFLSFKYEKRSRTFFSIGT